jgi:hypothetical protein
MKRQVFSRREAIRAAGALAAGAVVGVAAGKVRPNATWQLAAFQADITPPLGHPLIAGLRMPAKTIQDRLSARGVVLSGGEAPLVVCGLDWCELRNDAYDAFRDALAKAAGTDRSRVLLSCLHQHDAPYFDLTAQKLLDKAGLKNATFDPAFFEQAVEATAAALRESLARQRELTHVGVGTAIVERVACNRRVVGADGTARFNRYSFVRDPAVRDAPEGEIDPQLKQLTFYAGEEPLAAISLYATHPMSYYGNGEVSYDFPGMARAMRERETPGVMQIYLTGCSGDVVAAKYNDGTPEGRRQLAERLYRAMQQAAQATKRLPLERIAFRAAKVELPPPDEGKLTIDALEQTIADDNASASDRIHAALGLSYRRRCDAGQPIDVPAIDFGPAQLAILPAELFVGYQLAAQTMRPDQTVLTAGFGECAPGYIPTDAARREGFALEHGYCWVRAGVERTVLLATEQALAKSD